MVRRRKRALCHDEKLTSNGEIVARYQPNGDRSSWNNRYVDPGCKMDHFVAEKNDTHYCTLVCRNVRIGSYRTVPTLGVVFCNIGIQIPVASVIPGCTQTVNVNIDLEDIVKMLYHFGKQMPVLFLYLSAHAAIRIRDQLGMHDPKINYFEPTSTDETLKRIVIMPEKMTEESKSMIKSIYGGGESNKKGSLPAVASSTGFKVLMEELSQDEANTILVSASAPEVQAVVRQTAKSVNPMPQPSKTLLIYPPPPQKGGISITVDDYQVLEEESFLNDVILDFYLKYILLNKLSEEQRNKVHLFSTFFYKRLTCKPKKMRRHHPIEDDPKLSAAHKRHSRVKSWTKLVDIFDKDFVIIPINEHAHWFLAIVCFPGLRGPVHYETGEPVSAEVASATVRSHNNKLRSGRPRPRTEQIPIIDDGEWSDRDEAEGDEDELEDDDEDEEEGGAQPSRKKPRTNDMAIPGLGGEDRPSPISASGESLPPIKQPCILIFDSLSGSHRARIVATLRDYLSVEHAQKRGEVRPFTRDTMKGACPRVPQQTNYSDCGLYTLQFTESFFELPVLDYRLPLRTISNWFDQSIVAGKREAIALLIKDLMNKYNPNNNIKLPDIYFNTAEERQKGGRASCQVEERERLERLSLEKSRDKANKSRLGDVDRGEKIPLLGDDGVGAGDAAAAASNGNDGTTDKTEQPNLSKGTVNSVEANKSPPTTETKTKEGNVLTCSMPDNKMDTSTTNSDQSNGIRNTLPNNVKGGKPTLIRPGNDNNYSNNNNTKSSKPAANEPKSKKLILGAIPVAAPFGTQPIVKSFVKSVPPTPLPTVVTTQGRSIGSGLASIRDTYTFDDDVEDNNNERVSSVKQRPDSVVGVTAAAEGGGVVTAVRVTAAGGGVGRSLPSATPGNGMGLVTRVSATVSLPSSTTATVVAESVVSTTIITTSVVTTPANTVPRATPEAVPAPKTQVRTDHAHLSKYPILASSLGNGNTALLANKSKPLPTLSNASESSNISVNDRISDKPIDNVSSSSLLKGVNEVSSTGTKDKNTILKNGHHEFIVGEISGKKAVYSEDNSEVYMYLSSEEGNSQSQPGSERGDANSPDLYSDLDVNPSNDQSASKSETSVEEDSSTIKAKEGESAACSPLTADGSGSSNSSLAPACFRFSERGTSSGRVIAPPKRYLDHSSTDVAKRKKKGKNVPGNR